MSAVIAGVVTFFSGIAGVVAIVILVNGIAYITDRLPCLQNAALTAEELEARRTASVLTKKSGLAGLLRTERDQVYRTFFESRAFPYYSEAEEKAMLDDNDNEEASQNSNSRAKSKDDVQTAVEAQKSVTKPSSTAISSPKVAKSEADKMGERESNKGVIQSAETLEDDTNSPSCSICLNLYSFGDKVILGTNCSHMFHYDCCMQWIEKGNEHCPYCRKIMISADEFYCTAIQVVGEDRVAKLKRINEQAAERMAFLAQNGRNSIDFPVPPVGRAPENTDIAEQEAITSTTGDDSRQAEEAQESVTVDIANVENETVQISDTTAQTVDDIEIGRNTDESVALSPRVQTQ